MQKTLGKLAVAFLILSTAGHSVNCLAGTSTPSEKAIQLVANDPSPISNKVGSAVKITPVHSPLQHLMAFNIAVFNKGANPASITPTDVKVSTGNGQSLHVYSLEELRKIANANAEAARTDLSSKIRANSGFSSAPMTQTLSGNHAERQQDMVNNDVQNAKTGQSFGAISADLERTLAELNAHVLEPTRAAPQQLTGGDVIVDMPDLKDNDTQTIEIVIDFAGDEHHFSFTATAKSQ